MWICKQKQYVYASLQYSEIISSLPVWLLFILDISLQCSEIISSLPASYPKKIKKKKEKRKKALTMAVFSFD
jgi:hypothetical protein